VESRPQAISARDPMSAASRRIELCQASDVTSGGALRVEAEGLVLAVFNVGGEFFVTDDACTHGPGSLSEGELEDDVIECNFHGGRFNVRTGEVVEPPCMVPVKTYPVVIERGRVIVELSD
jgi:nitrite reductase/ring-hydroxylating ferredoxin subunit